MLKQHVFAENTKRFEVDEKSLLFEIFCKILNDFNLIFGQLNVNFFEKKLEH